MAVGGMMKIMMLNAKPPKDALPPICYSCAMCTFIYTYLSVASLFMCSTKVHNRIYSPNVKTLFFLLNYTFLILKAIYFFPCSHQIPKYSAFLPSFKLHHFLNLQRSFSPNIKTLLFYLSTFTSDPHIKTRPGGRLALHVSY